MLASQSVLKSDLSGTHPINFDTTFSYVAYTLQKYLDRFPLDEIEIPEGYRKSELEHLPGASSKMQHIAWLKRINAAGQWKPAIQAYLRAPP